MDPRVFVLFLLWVVLAFGFTFRQSLCRRREAFEAASNETIQYTNDGEKPWQRHTMYGSLPIETKVKYPNAFYAELGTREFKEALQKTLVPEKCGALASLYEMAGEKGAWKEVIPNSLYSQSVTVEEAYSAMLRWLQEKIAASPFLKLPGNVATIQVVHDRLLASFVAAGADEKDVNTWRLDTELLLYRTGAYQGKHVVVTCIVKKNSGLSKVKGDWQVVAAAVDVVGVVSEDQIAMFPVNPSDPFAVVMDRQFSAFDTSATFAPPPSILLSAQDIQTEVDRRARLHTTEEAVTRTLSTV